MTGDSRTTTADKLVLDHLDRGEQLAVWQAGREGLAWMDRLVNDRRAIAVSDNGYPSIFVARAEDVVRTISSPGGPPKANRSWVAGPSDLIGSEWQGRTTIDNQAVAKCPPHEGVIVVAWDEN
jgi:hypothetical protein